MIPGSKVLRGQMSDNEKNQQEPTAAKPWALHFPLFT